MPDPPLVVSVSGVRYVPAVDVTVNAACAALPSVTVVGADDMAKKLASAALVAVTEHVPALALDSVNGATVLTAQPLADPFEAA